MIQAIPVSAFTDNYIWLIPIPGDSHRVVIVDPGQADPALDALRRLDLEPAAILVTHHHFDHCGGVAELVAAHRVPVYGPLQSPARGIDHPVRDGDGIGLADGFGFQVLAVPGHTLDHIAYFGPGAVFCGDTLFTAGCGRLFEGTAPQMLQSLSRLAALPGSTRVYCGHEYTLKNLEFARRVNPDNAAIAERLNHAHRLRDQGRPTVPSTLDEELLTNPFLRCREPEVVRAAERAAGRALPTEQEVFAVIRQLKDEF